MISMKIRTSSQSGVLELLGAGKHRYSSSPLWEANPIGTRLFESLGFPEI